jgi:hypothetical protein
LQDINIPSSVTSIKESTFSFCEGLQSLTLPNSIKSIGKSAFYNCASLKSITIPDSVKSIGESAFQSCKSLKSIVSPKLPIEAWDSSALKLAATFGYMQDPSKFIKADIAEGYKKCAFSQRKKLLPLIFETDTASALALYAEEKKITAKNFEDEYLALAKAADAKMCIAFLEDWQSKNISQNDPPKEVDTDTYSVANMKKIWSYIKLDDGTLCLTAYKGDEINVTIPPYIGKATVSRIGDCTFSSTTKKGDYKPAEICEKLSKIESVFIGDNITVIGEQAFCNCRSLKNITIPNSVVSIGDFAFFGCEKLEKITIPSSVTSIGEGTFNFCSSLKSVVIPSSVTLINENAFKYCPKLKTSKPKKK